MRAKGALPEVSSTRAWREHMIDSMSDFEHLGDDRHLVRHLGALARRVGLFLRARHGRIALGDLRHALLADGWGRRVLEGVEVETFRLGVARFTVGRNYGLPVEPAVLTLRRRAADITGVSKGSML